MQFYQTQCLLPQDKYGTRRHLPQIVLDLIYNEI